MKLLRMLLTPAVNLMHRLRYPYKFAAIGLLGGIAIAYLFYALTMNLQRAADIARQEQAGLAADVPLLTLLQTVQQQQGLLAAVAGGAHQLEARRRDNLQDVQLALAAANQAVARHGGRLDIATHWAAVQERWRTLQAGASTSRDDHAALSRELMAVIEQVGDTSFLVLDPDANSYYLMLAATDKLPKALEMVGRIRAHGAEVLAAKSITPEGQRQFIGEVAVLQARLDELEAVLHKAEKTNPQVAERIARFSRQFREALKEVLVEVAEDIFGGRYAADPVHYVDKTTAAIDRGFDQTRDVLLPLLDELLAARISQLEQQFFRSAVLAGPAFMILFVYLASGACLAVMSSIKSLRDGADRMAQGDFVTPILLASKDELRYVALSFNDMGVQLSRRVREADLHTCELEVLNRKLAELSATDGLTGIANRRRFDEALASEWSRAARLRTPLALAMLDVDWFKKFNDHYGHQAGDECLRRMALVLAGCMRRAGDLGARYGGEEFAFIAPNCDERHARNLAEKITNALQSLAIPHQLSEFGYVTVSIGVAVIIPGAGDTPDCLMRAADAALYRAKEQGRNRAVFDNAVCTQATAQAAQQTSPQPVAQPPVHAVSGS